MPSSQMTPDQYLEVARDTIRSAEFGFLVTTDLSDRLYARLMQTFEPGDDWRIWLGTSPRTCKIAEISHNENVLPAFFQCEPRRLRNGRRTGNAGDGRGPEKKVLARRIRHVLAGRPGRR